MACVTGLRTGASELEVLVSHAIGVATKLVANYGCRGTHFTESIKGSVYELAREGAVRAGIHPSIAANVARGVLDAICVAHLASPPAGSERCAGVFVGTSAESVAREIGTIVGHMHGAMALSVMWLSHQACEAKHEIVWLLDTTLPSQQWFNERLRGTCEQQVVEVGFALIPRMLDLAMRLSSEGPANSRQSGGGTSTSFAPTFAPTGLATCAPGAPCEVAGRPGSVAGSVDNGPSKAAGLGVAIAILFALDNHRIHASFSALFGALARYVCAGSYPGRSLRSLILDTVSRILLEGCARLPEQAQASGPHELPHERPHERP
jgi:hypothetical protein